MEIQSVAGKDCHNCRGEGPFSSGFGATWVDFRVLSSGSHNGGLHKVWGHHRCRPPQLPAWDGLQNRFWLGGSGFSGLQKSLLEARVSGWVCCYSMLTTRSQLTIQTVHVDDRKARLKYVLLKAIELNPPAPRTLQYFRTMHETNQVHVNRPANKLTNTYTKLKPQTHTT